MGAESRLGTIKTNRLDTPKQNKEKQRFEFFQQYYKNILVNIAVSINALEELVKPNSKNMTFNNYCPAFVSTVEKNFWAQSVIGLNVCFRGKNSYEKYINYVKANWDKIFTGKWEDTIHWSDNTSEKENIIFRKEEVFGRIDETGRILDLEENRLIIDKIKTFRDKVFAHVDEETPRDTICLTELRKAFTFAEDIFNKLQVAYDRVYVSLEPVNSKDINNLIHIVSIYDTYKKQIQEIDYKAKYER